MSTVTYGVEGLTCGYCMAEVMERVRAVEGVTAVAVDLAREGRSVMAVTSGVTVEPKRVRAAVQAAGFDLAGERTRERAHATAQVAGSAAAGAQSPRFAARP